MNKTLTSLLFLCLFAFVSSQDFTRFLGLRDLQGVTDEYGEDDNGETEEPLEEGGLEEECSWEEGGAEEETNLLEVDADVDVDVDSRLLSFRNLQAVTDKYEGEDNGETESPVEEGGLEEECLLEEGGAEEGSAEEEDSLWEGADAGSRLLGFRNLQAVTDEYNEEDNGEAESPVEEGEVEEEFLLEEGGSEEGGAEEENYLWEDLNARLLGFRNLQAVTDQYNEEDNGETESPVEEGEVEEEYLLEEGGAEEEGYLWRDDTLVL